MRSDNKNSGEIDIFIYRDNVLFDKGNAKINKLIIKDNGIGFDDENRNSFNILYSPQKSAIGGKGLGRMFYIKFFRNVSIESVYKKEDKYRKRKFDFGREYEIIKNEVDEEFNDDTASTGATLTLDGYQGDNNFGEDINRFAHRILEKILNYFVDESQACPKITIHDGDSRIALNNLIGDNDSFAIRESCSGNMEISERIFKYRMFELQNVYGQKSRIMLTAHNKVVTDAKLEDYVLEFETDFVKKDSDDKEHKYIVRFYVYGDFLDMNVNSERTGFRFGDYPDGVSEIGRKTIEEAVAREAKRILSGEVMTRFAEKKERVEKYANENIWYKNYLEYVNLEKIKMNPSDVDIEAELHKVKFEKDSERRRKIADIAHNLQVKDFDLNSEVSRLVADITETDRSNLAEYIARRQSVLMLFEKALEWDLEGKFEREKTLHSIIFPARRDSDDTTYDEHNLWIIDERLNFTTLLSSDKTVFNGSEDRPDIAAFHYPVSYREGEEGHNPVSIFEFKKPGRRDFINPSSNEDPIEQIIRYVNQFKDGKVKQLNGRNISINDTTPFYGYVIASADEDVKKWLKNVKDMKMTPDGEGWIKNVENINLRIEFITWDKLLRDAKTRHRVFFEKLGLA
ncbi:MAG: hypothetical protein Q4B29_01405 [Candidatus Saccharibacteria bacterium]|nr:hypothetical protein [Candidatus Saccharibacteria bacterium]